MADIKLADGSSPAQIFKGSTEVLKVYKGSTLVWEKTTNSDVFRTRYSSNSFLNSGTFTHDWSSTYGMTGVQGIFNAGVLLNFSTTAERDTFLASVPTAGIRFVVDEAGEYGGPDAGVICSKANLTTSGTSVVTDSLTGNNMIDLMVNVFGMTNGDTSDTKMEFA
jgi:hypothetical protein